MKVQIINSCKNLNFGEMNQFGTVITVGSLNDAKKTICLGNEFRDDVFEYARKKAKLPKDYNMNKIISIGDLFKLTDTSSVKARKTKLIKILIQKGLLKK